MVRGRLATRLMRRAVVLAAVVVGAVAAAGCAAVDLRNAVPNAALAQTASLPDIQGVRYWADEVPLDPIAEYRKRAPHLKQITTRGAIIDGRAQVYMLALSGGGSYGAFGAGILTGWTARGDRPEFSVVTGVSAGAIIAPFAFLGPRYDRQLREIWTEYRTDQLIVFQVFSGILGGGAALADTKPLADLIARYVDRRMMAEIAREHRKGRLLLIGTTNLDAQRPVVWNVGELAVHGTDAALDTLRKVILASASIPGAFPPVEIEVSAGGKRFSELHVDGGTTRQVFLSSLNVPLRTFNPLYAVPPRRHVYVVNNGYLSPEYQPVKEQTIHIAGRSIATLLLNQGKNDIYRIWREVEDDNGVFRVTTVPDNFKARPKELFDPVFQTALFDEGYRLARAGKAWSDTPPDMLPGTIQVRQGPAPAPATPTGSDKAASAEPSGLNAVLISGR